MTQTWLPALITLEEHAGNWDRYLKVIYGHFRRDFVLSQPRFKGSRVGIRRKPDDQDKEATFWHLISEGEEDERYPNLRRCERIRWPRPIIEHHEELCIKVWENQRRGKSNVCIWYEEVDYLVVLGRRRDYMLLLSAYPVQPHTKRRLRREYEAYIANTACKADGVVYSSYTW